MPYRIDLAKSRNPAIAQVQDAEETQINYSTIIKVAVVCVFIFAITFFFSNQKVLSYEKKISSLAGLQNQYSALTIDEIKNKQTEIAKKTTIYSGIRLKSNVSFFLEYLPELLPEGMWLTKLSIGYAENTEAPQTSRRKRQSAESEKKPLSAKIALDMEGYVYRDDPRQQSNVITEFFYQLKNDQEFSTHFRSVDLNNVNRETLEEFAVTRFQIQCR